MPVVGQTPTGVLYEDQGGNRFEIPADVYARMGGSQTGGGYSADAQPIWRPGDDKGPQTAQATPPALDAPTSPLGPDTLSAAQAPGSMPPPVDMPTSATPNQDVTLPPGYAFPKDQPPSATLAPGRAPADHAQIQDPIQEEADAGAQEQAAIGERARIQAETNARNARLMQDQADESRRQGEQLAAMRQQHIQQAQQDSVRLQQQSDELMRSGIDPNHYFSSMPVWGKITSILGLVAGGIWATAPGSGGKNPALEIINDNINRDIEAQKANLQNKRAGLEANRGLYALNLQRWGNEEVAAEATRKQMWDAVANQISVNNAQLASPLAILDGQQQAAASREKGAAAIAK